MQHLHRLPDMNKEDQDPSILVARNMLQEDPYKVRPVVEKEIRDKDKDRDIPVSLVGVALVEVAQGMVVLVVVHLVEVARGIAALVVVPLVVVVVLDLVVVEFVLVEDLVVVAPHTVLDCDSPSKQNKTL